MYFVAYYKEFGGLKPTAGNKDTSSSTLNNGMLSSIS
jgi:hypothetical protein